MSALAQYSITSAARTVLHLRPKLANIPTVRLVCTRAPTCSPTSSGQRIPREPIAFHHHRRPPASASHARFFSSTRAARSEPSDALPDPTRPDLFYHPTTPTHPGRPRRFALSFIPSLPTSLRTSGPAVIGWLPAEAPTGEEEAGLNDFVENPEFREVLQTSVASALDDGVDEVWTNGAIQAGEGWMHIHDERNPPPLGRIGDPDDILGSVRVEGGKILPGTYQPMPAYRLATADGVTHLTPGLAARLVQDLEAAATRDL